MKKRLIFSVLPVLASIQFSFAQSDLPAPGQFSNEELNMKECPFDKDADAVILFDDARSNYDDEYRLITTHRIRIKILTERGLDEGNIKIDYHSGDDFEYLKDISATTYVPGDNGGITEYQLDKKSIYNEKIDQYYSRIKFAFPNVKPGCILEYQYESDKKSYSPQMHWDFQSYLPVVRSSYLLQILPNAEFTYIVQKKSNYPITVRPQPDQGEIYFEMDNIPGLNEEPYMDAPKDYLQRVELQFSGYSTVQSSGYGTTSSKQEVNTTWRALANDLESDKSFGGALKKGLTIPHDLDQLVAAQPTETGKLTVIYNYVRDNFTADEYYYGIYVDEDKGLKTVWDDKKGFASEINFILLSLLRNYKIESYPLLVAERDFGKVDTLYPLVSRFNKTAAYAIADNNIYILDATQKYCPYWLTPFPLLNTYAFLVDRKKFQLFLIKSNEESYKNVVTIHAKLSEKGILSGTVNINSDEYARLVRSEGIRKDEKKFIQKYLASSHEGIGIDSFHCENLSIDSLPLSENFLFTEDLNENGGFVLLNYNLFTGIEKNPFIKDERFTNIDFGFPYNVSVYEEIELPPNCKIDELPQNKKVISPHGDISVSRIIERKENKLVVSIQFMQTETLFSNQFYNVVKSTYQTAIDMLNEQIAIKLGN